MENENGETNVFLNVDHHQRMYTFAPDVEAGAPQVVVLSKEEILDLAKAGDIRASFSGNICEINVKEGQEVEAGERVAVMEAMKMQTPVASEISGIVTLVSVKIGDALQSGDKIIKIDVDE